MTDGLRDEELPTVNDTETVAVDDAVLLYDEDIVLVVVGVLDTVAVALTVRVIVLVDDSEREGEMGDALAVRVTDDVDVCVGVGVGDDGISISHMYRHSSPPVTSLSRFEYC